MYRLAAADSAAGIQIEAFFTGINVLVELLVKFNDEIERLEQAKVNALSAILSLHSMNE